MNGALAIGSVSLRAQQKALDTIANNIANVNTPTFKRSDIRFSEVMAIHTDPVSQVDMRALQEPSQTGGVRMTAHEMNLEQGEIRISGNKLDLAIDGPGFIELMGPEGQNLLWRGGRLQVNADGLLASSNGLALRAAITIPDDATNLQITPEGIVRADVEGEGTIDLGQITLARVDNEAQIERFDGGMFKPALDARVTDARAGEDGAGLFAQGSTESSNVQLTTEMVDFLTVQRAFAASAQIVQAADQISGILNSLKR